MKKIIYALILSLVVLSGLLFSFAPFTYRSGANREIKNEPSKKTTPKSLSSAERKAALKKWEASPDGIMYKKWEVSPAGKKVYASEAKLRNTSSNYSKMEGVITSLSLPPGSRLGFGMMLRIKGDDYILAFGPEMSNEYKQLHSLKVNDKIIIRSYSVSHAPKYSFPIIASDYVERDSKIIYKRTTRKKGC